MLKHEKLLMTSKSLAITSRKNNGHRNKKEFKQNWEVHINKKNSPKSLTLTGKPRQGVQQKMHLNATECKNTSQESEERCNLNLIRQIYGCRPRIKIEKWITYRI